MGGGGEKRRVLQLAQVGHALGARGQQGSDQLEAPADHADPREGGVERGLIQRVGGSFRQRTAHLLYGS